MHVDIKHLAWLARIELTEDEAQNLRRRIEGAMRIISKLLEADIEGLKPLYHPQEEASYLRPDEVKPPRTSREKMLDNAARVENGFIVAPRTVED